MAHAIAKGNQLDHCALGAWREARRTFALKGERQAGGGWQALLEVYCQTIGWHNIKAHAWQKHDSLCLGLCIPGSYRFIDWYLASNIQVVPAQAKTAIHHRLEGVNIWASTEEYYDHTL